MVIRGPWKPIPWDKADRAEQMLRMFRVVVDSASENEKDGIFQVLERHVLALMDLAKVK